MGEIKTLLSYRDEALRQTQNKKEESNLKKVEKGNILKGSRIPKITPTASSKLE